ncbi:BZ3500_MvSof-1268-A1-R1_Chr11-2g03334 [Microbotryum saponariae]|uniref:histone deacetylase n=1 Tax=Microbotryum saponariae TaxID=289078 RepID=A0A2X0KSF1_9BASI|nr:BZ3500_MvSof-1268-A1-R1_Chr11-2g03334 [Microbotryum saponariae]SDA03147.1 BZ3501_MvSof-1269-A2-R1_Chr11g02905 [Microbotryum saponariae]
MDEAGPSQQPYTQAIPTPASNTTNERSELSAPSSSAFAASVPAESDSQQDTTSSSVDPTVESSSSFPVPSTSIDIVVDPPRLSTVGAPAAPSSSSTRSTTSASAAPAAATQDALRSSTSDRAPTASSAAASAVDPVIITHNPDGSRAPVVAHVLGFAAVRAIANAHPNPQPYVEPPPYVAPTHVDSASTGIAKNSHPVRISLTEEEERMRPEQRHALQVAAARAAKAKTPEVMREEQVLRLDAKTLKKMGLGRTPSGYCYSSRMTMHQQLPAVARGELHPEQPARITGIYHKLNGQCSARKVGLRVRGLDTPSFETGTGFLGRMERIAVREALRDEVTLVHSQAHFDRVRALGFQTPEYLETCSEYFDRLSLYVNPDTALCARLSCGGVIEMCGAVAEGRIRNGFAIVRPPGHHAEPEDAMGFCFFNNVAVAAKWLRTIYDDGQGAASQFDANSTLPSTTGTTRVKKMNKILILDWDVHHGNGTQKAFWDDPNVLYMSLHRHDGAFYPGGTYGAAETVGDGPGKGFSVNVPFPHTGMGDADYIYAFQQIIMPIAYEFAPDFVLVSAGYDAAEGDELGQMKVTPAGFAHMTHLLSVLADGKLVLALEGGYNVESVVKSAHACVEVLVGDEPRRLELGAASQSATNVCHEVMKVQSKYWKSMGYALESPEEAKDAGRMIPLAEMLKSHRVYELYHDYAMYNIELADPELEEAYKDQVLCSSDVYDCETLIIFMHDIGSMKASFTAANLDIDLERTTLIDTSREVLDWAITDNNFGLIDVNFLAHTVTNKGTIIPPDLARDARLEKELALFVWDQIAGLSVATNIVLFSMGTGSRAMMHVLQNRQSVRERVRACIEILGLEHPPELGAESGIRGWFKEKSLVMLPSTHPLHEDSRKAGKHQKKYGNVFRSMPDDEGRPIHLLRASMGKVKEFVRDRLPVSTRPPKERGSEEEEVVEKERTMEEEVGQNGSGAAIGGEATAPTTMTGDAMELETGKTEEVAAEVQEPKPVATTEEARTTSTSMAVDGVPAETSAQNVETGAVNGGADVTMGED